MNLFQLRSFLIFYFVFLSLFSLKGQGLIVEIALEDRLEQADFVVEAEVLSGQSFWDIEQANIYTSNTCVLKQSIKGSIAIDTIFVITRGGRIGNFKQVDFPSLQLNSGMRGLLLLKQADYLPAGKEKSKSLYFEPLYATQSFLHYDLPSYSVNDVFDKSYHINELYTILEETLNVHPERSSSYTPALSSRSPDAISLSSFSPTSTSAGTQSVLTINGSGFGATQGSGRVQFRNADSGGANYIIPAGVEYVSWSNTQIQVQVPDGAGTGNLKVYNSGGESVESSSDLNIVYNVANVFFDNTIFRINVVDADGNGGYEFQFHSDFYNNSAAKNSFIRAMDTWRCSNGDGSGIVWEEGGSTSTDAAVDDGINIVRFDNGSELPGGVLGRTTNRYQACFSSGNYKWFVYEIDLVFDQNAGGSGTSWNFDAADGSTSSGEMDFESVAVHELGHGHQLGHVINTSDVMHYNISVGTEKRYLNQDDLDGGNDVLTFSSSVCGNNSMADSYFCSSLPIVMLDFYGIRNAGMNVLSALLSSDSNPEKIILMKSQDGADFNDLVEMKLIADGEDGIEYQAEDPFPGSQSYYKLRMLDADGLVSFSDIIRLTYIQDFKNELQFYPNPVAANLTVTNDGRFSYEIDIFDNLNRSVINKMTLGAHSELRINLSNLSPGLYQFCSTSAIGKNCEKFVKN